MIAFIVLLSVAAVLQQSPGNADFASESSNKREIQKEIVDKNNALRRSVTPTASNMLQMEWNSNATQNAKRWADKLAKPCKYVNMFSNCKILAKQIGCRRTLIQEICPATCFCPNEII